MAGSACAAEGVPTQRSTRHFTAETGSQGVSTTEDLTEKSGTNPQTDPSVASESGAGFATPGPNWPEQDETLRAMWMRKCSPQEISDALGRSIPAIMTRAARLGLPRRSAPGRKPGQHRPLESSGADAARAAARQRADSHDKAQSMDNPAPAYAERICLMCLSRFQSAGRHNRICPSCKNSSEYTAASSLPDIQYSSL